MCARAHVCECVKEYCCVRQTSFVAILGGADEPFFGCVCACTCVCVCVGECVCEKSVFVCVHV